MSALRLFLILLFAASLPACMSPSGAPKVSVLPNTSGLCVAKTLKHGPDHFITPSYEPPNVPPGTTLALKRTEALHNKEPRYFVSASGSLQVVSIAEPEKYELTKTLKGWKPIIDGSISDSEARRKLDTQLSEIPWMNAGRCFHAKLQRHNFPWGKAVMFITTYVQGKTGGPVNSDMLVLVVQGITHDGKYAVKGHFEIHHPSLPLNLWDEKTGGKVRFSIDEESDQAERWLDKQPDSSFTPTIGSYVKFLEALRIGPAAR